MDHQVDSTSIRGLAITSFLWVFAHFTSSDLATYCTIISAIVTIFMNVHKFITSRKKNNKNAKRSNNA